MILDDVALIASDTHRTKAYIQMMIKEKLKPSMCLVYSDNKKKLIEEAEGYTDSNVTNPFFCVDEPIIYSLNKAGIKYCLMENKDINSEEMAEVIRPLPQKYLIYSGYGGYILKPHLFEMGKEFIHVHAGILPQYRGSTTVYYSMLQEKMIGATAIFLNENIDEGAIITAETFPLPSRGENVDLIYEPYVRSQVLKLVLREYEKTGSVTANAQQNEDAQTYFVIHPVLKHLALLALDE